ncbi:YheV family putative zinc ribbon protein [Aeromonas simiae]|uniref:YheV family putative metal-binding protein n=1 Tax=Aeromonas simiae TaxID=218936 RepID=A0A5J6WWQ4_9GAMM|nr:YheV family putative zinc ribbon protein [Aeromonas simiae]MDO2948134.1 YheV family putative metal-binding protein [Aeromonas simiae]MDO2953822.1 YheV family putative metal-binding protein [Aeromonas simiae]MDO2955447.1 YheV family putative metal-binding protein [Aeromonas simiae]QFI55556.1 YheV family putative metal-binding protein [Aeromonas simiae]
METKRKKRFIAGAVCPACSRQDTMMLYLEHGVEKVTCIECGDTQVRPTDEVTQATREAEQVIGVFRP